MKKLLALLLCALMAFALIACTKPAAEEPAAEEPAAEEPAAEEPAAEAAAEGLPAYYTENAEYEVLSQEGTRSLNDYYTQYNVECDMTIRSGGPDLYWHGGADVELPTPKEKYTIAFSAYNTFDEVGAMYLAGMQQAADEAGIDLLVNDADYDQNLQNQAIEQWILQDVDAVIMTACDFYGCKDALDALEAAGIPVITLDAPPCAGNVDCVVMYDCVEQGKQAADALIAELQAKGSDMNGTVYYGTLPFIHPNAVLREYGFIEAFKEYPNVTIKALTGEETEEHYTAFEGILQGDPTIIGLWGLYSSATWGIMQAAQSAGVDFPITSVDNDRVILEGIYNGQVLGSSCYGAVEGSRLALAATILKLNGENIPSVIFQGNTFVDKSNVAEAFETYYNGATLADYIAK